MNKNQIRAEMREFLLKLSPQDRHVRSLAACQQMLATREFKNAQTIMIFMSMPTEVETGSAGGQGVAGVQERRGAAGGLGGQADGAGGDQESGCGDEDEHAAGVTGVADQGTDQWDGGAAGVYRHGGDTGHGVRSEGVSGGARAGVL